MLSDFTYTLTGSIVDGVLKNRCNTELDFKSYSFEVCILDMLFMLGSWDNVRPGANVIKYCMGDAGDVQELHVPVGNYHTSIDFLTIVGKTTEGVGKSVSMGSYHVLLCEPLVQIQFFKELAFLMGAIDALTMPLPWLKNSWNTPKENIDPKRNNLSMLWLFGDFVGNTIIGNLQLPMLRFVPIKVGSGIMEHAIFSTQHYVRVKRGKVQNLRITFKESLLGSTLNVSEPVALTLHFRSRE